MKNKIALLIGINYTNTSIKLKGSHNDVLIMKKILSTYYDYLDENIVILIDDVNNIQPTKSNIIAQLNYLHEQTKEKKIDEIYIHYSGHCDISNKNKSIKYIIPIDYKQNGIIPNKIFNNFLYKLKNIKKITIVFDCCNSANFINLPFSYFFETSTNDIKQNIYINERYTKKFSIFVLSSCQDSQSSYETNTNNKYYGTFTFNLKKILEKLNYSCNIKQLLINITNEFKKNQTPYISVNLSTHTINSLIYENIENINIS